MQTIAPLLLPKLKWSIIHSLSNICFNTTHTTVDFISVLSKYSVQLDHCAVPVMLVAYQLRNALPSFCLCLLKDILWLEDFLYLVATKT